MTAEITTVKKDGSLKLPKSAQRMWRGAKVSMRMYGSGDTLLIKRVSPSLSFDEMLREMRSAAKKAGITRKDVDNAIRKTRKKGKQVRTSEFWTTWQSLKSARGKISSRDITAAVQSVRSGRA